MRSWSTPHLARAMVAEFRLRGETARYWSIVAELQHRSEVV